MVSFIRGRKLLILQFLHSRVIPNAVIRSKGDKTTYFGHEFYKCRDHSSLHYRLPFEKVRTGVLLALHGHRTRSCHPFRVIWSTGTPKRPSGTECSQRTYSP